MRRSTDGEPDPVMEMVRRQLRRENPPSTKVLYARAVRVDPSVRELTLRQFHAKYPLQVKRERGRDREGRRTEADRPAPDSPPRSDGGRKETATDHGRPGEKHASLDGLSEHEVRERIRQLLLQYARAVVAASDIAQLDDAVSGVSVYVDAAVELLRAHGIEGEGP